MNAADDDDVISMYIDTTENVVIGGGKDLRIEGGGHKIHAANPGLPVIHVLSGAGADDGNTGKGERDIHIADLDVYGGSQGYLIETSKSSAGTSTLLKAIRAEQNGIGIKVVGNGNHVRGSNGVKNSSGDGIQVIGNGNLIEENRVDHNGGDGIDVTGNSNTLKKNKPQSGNTGDGIHLSGNSNVVVENEILENGGDGIDAAGGSNTFLKNELGEGGHGNGGDGLTVVGSGNTLTENEAFGNRGDGFDVRAGTSASPNILKKNVAGDSGKGNGGNGFLINGSGNGKPDPIELEENTARGNVLNGFQITGTGYELKKNVSGGSASQNNGDCEFLAVAGNFNAKDNKANNATVNPNTDGAAFPTTCVGTP